MKKLFVPMAALVAAVTFALQCTPALAQDPFNSGEPGQGGHYYQPGGMNTRTPASVHDFNNNNGNFPRNVPPLNNPSGSATPNPNAGTPNPNNGTPNPNNGTPSTL